MNNFHHFEVLNAIGLAVHFEYRQFINIAKSAIKTLFHDPTDVFWTGRVMDLLFDGIEIDCDTNVPLAKVSLQSNTTGKKSNNSTSRWEKVEIFIARRSKINISFSKS